MDLDIKKFTQTPSDVFQAIHIMHEAQQKLMEALHIMDSILINNEVEDWQFHEKRMKAFIKQFEKEQL